MKSKKTNSPYIMTLLCLFLSVPVYAEKQGEDGLGSTPGGKAVEAVLKDPKKSPENVNFNTGALESQYAKTPGFKSDSADQEARDQVVQENDKRFLEQTTDRIGALYKCNKLADVAASKECRKQEFSRKNKKQ